MRTDEIQAEIQALETLVAFAHVQQLALPELRGRILGLYHSLLRVDPATRGRIERLIALIAGAALPSPPTIVSISPALADPDGLIPFLLTGTNFIHVLSITFNPGGFAATGIGQDTATSTQISGFTPALAPGTYDVTIATLSGSFTLGAAFESWAANQIVAPAVAHVYDSEKGITTVGGFVSQWNDQGAGANNLTAGVGLRPAYEVGRFGDNLRHGLNYDAVDDALTLAAAIPLTNRTIFAAFKWNSAGAGATAELVSGTSGSIYDFAMDATGGITTMRTYDANIPVNRRSPDDPELNSGALSAVGIGGGSAKIVGETYDGVAGELRFYLNNTQQGAAVATTAVAVNWKTLGAGVGNPGSGLQGAVVLVEDIITALDRGKLVTWLWGKWIARSTVFSRLDDNTPWFARDGAQLLALGDDIYMLGGWNSQGGGAFPAGSKVTNEVWKSVDKGVTWALIKAHDYTPPVGTFWTPRHTHGAVTHSISGVNYLYVIGSDIYNGPQNNLGTGVGTSDVWRSTDGVNWALVTDTAPWGPRVLHMVASLNGKLYVMGGLTDSTNANSALNDVWESSDGGVSWAQLANAPWAPRGLVNSGQGLPVKNGKIWLMGGGTYVNVPAGNLYNDVWSFNGTVWTQVLANGVAPWVARQYNTTFIDKSNRLAVSNGVSDFIGTNIGDYWTSDDGVTWYQQVFTPWRPSHADGVVAVSDRVVMGPGNGEIGQPAGNGIGMVFAITRAGFAP